MQLNSLSDADLWALIVEDNYRAFTVLFNRYWFRLYKTAQKYIKNDTACEEVVHDLFLNLWNRRQFLVINNFEHYLKASTRYQVYNYQKKLKTEHIVYRQNIDEYEARHALNNGQEKIHSAELESLLEEQLSVLPERCREIFLLSRKDHLSNNEIAERLSISKRSVENQITIALKHLRFNFKEILILVLLSIQCSGNMPNVTPVFPLQNRYTDLSQAG